MTDSHTDHTDSVGREHRQGLPHDRATSFVFVYGTLRRGEDNDITRLNPPPAWVGSAQMNGTLFHLGAYPGLLLGGSHPVRGEVYEITPALERVLDEIEGIEPVPNGEYTKAWVDLEVQGRSVRCLVYLIDPIRVHGCPILHSGDWVLEARRGR
jgi:gamma-glutamylcyclotransferase (GGCT)/AIG2-like uncharacterized protein YtfP